MQHVLSMRESAALYILAREAHGGAVNQQRSYRQRFGVSPIDSTCVAHCIAPTCKGSRDAAVRLEVRGPFEQRFIERDELASTDRRCSHWRLSLRRRRARLRGARARTRLNLLELRHYIPLDSLHHVRSDNSFCDKPLAPDFARRLVRPDVGIQYSAE